MHGSSCIIDNNPNASIVLDSLHGQEFHSCSILLINLKVITEVH